MKPGEVYGLTPNEVDDLLSGAGFGAVFSKRFMLRINRLTVAEKRAHPGLSPPRPS